LSHKFSQLKISEPCNHVKERQVNLKYLQGDISINLLKTSKMTIESLREEISEVKISAMGK